MSDIAGVDPEVQRYLLALSANCYHAANSNDQETMDGVLRNIRETITSYIDRE